MIRVIVADDEAVLREGIRDLLEQTPDINVVGSAADGRAAAELAQTTPADVLLVDTNMPLYDGYIALHNLRAAGHNMPVIFLSVDTTPANITAALAHGATGYVDKMELLGHLIEAIRAVHEGGSYMSPAVHRALERASDIAAD
jgi:DNA-binding NarL/FixJ family response regulator